MENIVFTNLTPSNQIKGLPKYQPKTKKLRVIKMNFPIAAKDPMQNGVSAFSRFSLALIISSNILYKLLFRSNITIIDFDGAGNQLDCWPGVPIGRAAKPKNLVGIGTGVGPANEPPMTLP